MAGAHEPPWHEPASLLRLRSLEQGATEPPRRASNRRHRLRPANSCLGIWKNKMKRGGDDWGSDLDGVKVVVKLHHSCLRDRGGGRCPVDGVPVLKQLQHVGSARETR